MKYTIYGFSQAYAVTLRKNIKQGDKEKLIKIDCTDLVILRWFVDFYPNMRKMTVDGQEYAWLSHKKLADDMPLLDINKRACIDRMQKLVEFGILKYRLLKEGGTFSLYAFGENYENLIRSNNIGDIRSSDGEGMRSNYIGVTHSNDIGEYDQPTNKDISTNYSNTINNNTNDKKVSKVTGSFDRIIANYTQDDEIKDLLQEWLKVRKAKRAAMTDRAIQMNIAKLDDLANKSGMTIIEYLSEVICRGWAAFYEIKQYGNQNQNNTNNNVFLDIAKDEGIF